jgi:hypothetical protein
MQSLAAQNNNRQFFQYYPATASLVIIGFSVSSFACLLARQGSVLNIGFPLGTLLTALFLYMYQPKFYFHFFWWIWFVSPLVRRLVDYQIGFTDPSPILIAPYLASIIPVYTVLSYLPKLIRQEPALMLPISGVCYGFIIGVLKQGLTQQVIISLLDWASPIVICCYLVLQWRSYPMYQQQTKIVFLVHVLFSGAYGLFQYLFAPEWDKLWMLNLGERAITFGVAEPLGIRVFGTLNSPLTFASSMMVGLIFIFGQKNLFTAPISVIGYLAFLLSLVRTSWLGWAGGVLTLLVSSKLGFKLRILMIMLIGVLLLIPFAARPEFSDMLSTRLSTLVNISEDGSAQVRKAQYITTFTTALFNFVGDGIGIGGADSSIIDVLNSMGWIGGIPYGTGFILLFWKISHLYNKQNQFNVATYAVLIGLLVQLPFGAIFIELPGVLLWFSLGLAIASTEYQRHNPKCLE